MVLEEAKATVEAASAEEAIEAARHETDSLPWETTDEEPNQHTEVVCQPVEQVCADFRAVGGKLFAREC